MVFSPLHQTALTNALRMRRQAGRRNRQEAFPQEVDQAEGAPIDYVPRIVDHTLLRGSLLAVPTQAAPIERKAPDVEESDEESAQLVAQILRNRLKKLRSGNTSHQRRRRSQVPRSENKQNAEEIKIQSVVALESDRWAWLNEENKALLLQAQTMMGQLQRSGAREEHIQKILQQIHVVVVSRGARSIAKLAQLTQFTGKI
jgi:hypothetical protein